MKKRLLSIVLLICMVLTILPVPALAEEADAHMMDAENPVQTYASTSKTDSAQDPRSGVVFTLTASDYKCAGGHSGDVTKLRVTDVDTRSWDAEKTVTLKFEIYYRCYVSGCYYNKDNMGVPDATVTVKKEDSCHHAFDNEVTCSLGGSVKLRLTSDRSVAYKRPYPERPATCTEDGNDAYWMCGDPSSSNPCGKIFSDAACTQEISEPVIYPALGHDFTSPTAHHEAKTATCVSRGNREYWECGRCESFYSDDKGTTEVFSVTTPEDANNHEQEPVYTVYDEWHTETYPCCSKTNRYVKHTLDRNGVCEKCGYGAPFKVWGSDGDAYYGTFRDAYSALKAEDATTLEIVRDYDSNINLNSEATDRLVRIAKDVTLKEIYIGSKTSITIQNYGTVELVDNNYGTVVLREGKGGVYKRIKTDAGTVGDMLGTRNGTRLLYKTADGAYLRADNEACNAANIENVQVMFPPISYVEITGAGKESGEDHDLQYALTVKAGQTVKLRSDAYNTGATDYGPVSTQWDCGSIPSEKIDVQLLLNNARSVLTLTDLPAGEYTLVCTSKADVGAGYAVRATVALTVEEPGDEGYTLLFDANGGSGAPEPMTGETGEFIIPDTIPTHPGDGTASFHFTGWAIAASGSDAAFTAGDALTIPEGQKSLTLYAVWKAHGDFLEPKDGFCDGGGECLHEKDADGYCLASGCTHNAGGHDCCPQKDPRTVIERDGQWSITIGKGYDGTTAGELHTIYYTDGTNQVTLTDREGRANCTIKVIYDTPDAGRGKTVTVTVTLTDEAAQLYRFQNGTAVDTFTTDGYIDKAIPDLTLSMKKTEFLTGDWPYESISLTGVMEDAEVTYRYAKDPLLAGSEDYDQFNEPIYTYTGISEAGDYWVYATTSETANYQAGRTAPVQITVLAYCAVSFDGNGGSLKLGDRNKKLPYGDGRTYGMLPVSTREGYEFAGWYTAPEGGEEVRADTAVPEIAEQTLYAHWTPAHEHCVCGGTLDHTHENAEWQAWDGKSAIDYEWKWIPISDTGEMAFKVAYVYLTGNVSANLTLEPKQILYLCLNGYSFTSADPSQPTITLTGEKGQPVGLNLCDCGSTGTLGGSNASGGSIRIGTYADVTLYSGALTGNSTTENGGAVSVTGGNCSFTMYGGAITGNSAANGGGIYANAGSVTINGGVISDNRATNGGGIYATSSVQFHLNGGEIKSNTATNEGGGVFCKGLYSQTNARCEFYGGTISGNTAQRGGGAYAANCYVGYRDCRITGNTATEAGGGFYLTPPAAEKIMYMGNVYGGGGTITPYLYDNTVNSAQNNLYLSDPDTQIQFTARINTSADVKLGVYFTGITSKGASVLLNYLQINSESLAKPYLDRLFCDNPEYGQLELQNDNGYYNLYLRNTVSAVTVTFDPNGGTLNAGEESKLVQPGSPYGPLPTPARVNYRFDGWFTAKDGGEQVIETTVVASQTAHTLYARWTFLHEHCICGGDTAAGDHTAHSAQAFTAWNGTDAISYTNHTAYVYLLQNATISSNLVVDGTTLYLCLSGNTFASNGTNKIQVKNGGRLVLCDCAGGGTIKGATKGWGGSCVYLYKSTLDIFGGTITGGKVSGNGGGGAIALDDSKCVLNIYGGAISGNNSNKSGGAIFLNSGDQKGGTVNMYGGTISGNTAQNGGAIYSECGGTIHLAGGTISGNTATNGDGGVINMAGGTITLSGAKLTGNTSSRYGGAIYLYEGVTATMTGGELSGNKATKEGGAVHVYGKDSTFHLSGGSITGNSSVDGGAIYLNREPSVLTMTGGTIRGNTATGNGGAVYIYRTGSVCNLSGGTIEENTAGGSGGGIYINSSNSGKLNLSGAPVVKNNTVSGKANNVYLPSGRTLTIDGALTGDASIGVTTADTSYPVAFSGVNDADYAEAFFADDETAHVEYGDDQILYLTVGALVQKYTVTVVSQGSGSAYATPSSAAEGAEITLTAVPEAGSHFARWLPDDPRVQVYGNTFFMPAGNVRIMAVFEAHSFTQEVAEEQYLASPASCEQDAVYYKSCTCGEKGTETFTKTGSALSHDWGAWTSNGDGTHSRVCSRDASHTQSGSCSGGTATCVAKAICEVCHAAYGERGAHTFRTEWSADETMHWHACTLCDTVSDSAPHDDADRDHACDTCGKTVSNHADADNDHVCDICGKAISNHEDADNDHICDICGKTVSNHEDADNDHVCDVCGKTISNHEDADNDHVCDICGKTVSNHADADNDHVCDICGKVISNHEDADNDHICDICGKVISNHDDADNDHICDVCGKTVSNHKDADNDHVCDICSKTVSNHADADNDHVCDICGKTVSNHADTDNDHICDVCGKTVSNHADTDNDHICDVCGKVISNHEDANNDHVCDICGKTVSNHEDADNDHVCDICGKVISNHNDADNDHVCDICGKVISNHEDVNNDHVCDICGKTVSNHEDADNDHECDICGKIISNHTGGTATCLKRAVCEICGKPYGELGAHSYSADWSSDNAGHWHACALCGARANEAAHAFGGWQITRQPTAHRDGEQERFCGICTYRQTQRIPALGGATTGSYTIQATAGPGGSISPDGSVGVREGGSQTFYITPNRGYAVADVQIDGRSIGAVRSYTFENVRSAHTIEARFVRTGTFVDVVPGSYYEDAVDWAAENDITSGTDALHFSPDGSCTRAEAVTFLWRAAGSPAPTTRAMPFTDVAAGSYYYEAVLWAVERGIAKGTSATTFSPDETCTRAQIVSFLWRAEQSPAAGSANPFTDVAADAYYLDAVLWAVEKGVTKGTSATTFSPDETCTRAQIVTFLWRSRK